MCVEDPFSQIQSQIMHMHEEISGGMPAVPTLVGPPMAPTPLKTSANLVNLPLPFKNFEEKL